METSSSFSPQVKYIRKMQEDAGQTVCYATPAKSGCADKDCIWRHDCFEDSDQAAAENILRK